MQKAKSIEKTQSVLEKYIEGRVAEDVLPVIFELDVGVPVTSETTLTVADPEVPEAWAFALVMETPVGAIVVDGSMIPEGPNMTVVPPMVVVVTVLRAPAPILYVVPLMMAWEESMLNVSPPIVLTTYAAAVVIAGRYVVEAKATPLLFRVTVWPLITTVVASAFRPIE